MTGHAPRKLAPADRSWWLKMLIASTLLAGLLLSAHFLTPVVRLHYHAWRFRTGRDLDGESLEQVANCAVAHRLHRAAIVRLLGSPVVEQGGHLDYLARDGDITFSGGTAYSAGFRIVLRAGHAAGTENRVDLPLGALNVWLWTQAPDSGPGSPLFGRSGP